MVKRLMVVLVAVLLLNVGAAGAGTAGMAGVWSFEGDIHSETMPSVAMTGVFNFNAHSITLEGVVPFYGFPVSIYGPFTDLLNGYYQANDLLYSWSVNEDMTFDVQHWEITDQGNGHASVVNNWFPGNVINGTLTATVPEPASLLLIGSGLAGLVGLAGRRRRGR